MTIKKMRLPGGVELSPENIEGIGGADLTRDGEIATDSSDNELKVRLDGVTETVVTEDQVQVLTNKTIDADLNTISELEVDNLKAGVLNTSITLSGASNSDIPSALAVKTYIDNKDDAQNEASEISYDNTASGLSATQVQAALDEIDLNSDNHIASTVAHGATGAVVGTTNTQTLTNKTIDGNSNIITNVTATTNANLTGDVTSVGNVTTIPASTITSAMVLDGTLVNADISNSAAIAKSKLAAGTASRVEVTDASGFLVESSVTTTELGLLSGITAPLVTTTGTQTLTNKTITGASLQTPSRIDFKQDTKANLTSYATTAANGQAVYATDTKEYLAVKDGLLVDLGGGGGSGVGSVDTLVSQVFDKASLADFTQTGLELVSSPSIQGAFTARLIHQAASTRSFKQVVPVAPKFRGYSNTLSLSIRSSAASANATILVYDETNSANLLASTPITTGQITSAVFSTTNASATVGVSDNSILNQIKAGASITGAGIPTGTVVSSIGASFIVISQNTTATASSLSLKVSVLPATQIFTFQIPANCSSISYTVSALQEAGLPETYIDDVQIVLSESAKTSASIVVAGETKTIPLTSSVLVTQPDSYLRIVGFSGSSNGSTATKIASLASGTIQQNTGSAIQYLDDAINGARFVAQQEGLFRFSYSADINDVAATGTGFSLNSSNLTTTYNSIPYAEKISFGWDMGNSSTMSVGGEVYLKINDVVRIHRESNQVGASVSYSSFTASYQGSTKIINPSSDQKIEIPTHELRFEGASSRGSVSTAIVKFDTLTKIKGDGFEVTNTSALGTEVKIKKAGNLSVNANVYIATGNSTAISLNQSVLNTFPSGGEALSRSLTVSSASILPVNWSGIVKIGDVVRISSETTPNPLATNQLNLTLQETSVAVALQNVQPNWDNSDSAVRLGTGNGFGSVNTQVRRFANVYDNFGSDITYTDSATLGASFTINKDGLYDFSYTDDSTSASGISVVKNSTSMTFDGNNLGSAYLNNTYQTISNLIPLNKNDVVRLLSSTPASIASTSTVPKFTISKVGKTSGTVDVTPFVQIPTNDVEAIEALTATSTWGSTNTGVPVLNITKNTNKGIIQVISNSVEGTSFKALRDCELKISASLQSSITPNSAYITKNDTVLTAIVHSTNLISKGATVSTAGYNVNISASINLVAGDEIRVQRDGTGITTTDYVTLTATATSQSIVTPTQQVSSDTMNFAFKSTPITANDPIGTFNTYTYAANTNTATISASAPTQTVASMNVDGFRLFARAYNAASTTASPARVDIKIGKGLKGINKSLYKSTTKDVAGIFDYWIKDLFKYGFHTHTYNEKTGVLILDAGTSIVIGAAPISAQFIFGDGGATSDGYVVFNAGVLPTLASIPQLQPRIAYLSDVKPNGTDGGSSIAGNQTRVLNTLLDDSGIIKSFASNQFSLDAGVYDFEITAPAFYVNRHKVKLKNVTDTVTTLVGSSELTDNSGGGIATISVLKGRTTLTSIKTFQVEHFTNILRGLNGLGVSSSSGENEVYTQVKITKVK